MADEQTKKKEQRKVAVIDAVRWVCPFCGKDNGRPEIDVCACGAERVDEIVSRA